MLQFVILIGNLKSTVFVANPELSRRSYLDDNGRSRCPKCFQWKASSEILSGEEHSNGRESERPYFQTWNKHVVQIQFVIFKLKSVSHLGMAVGG